MLETECCICLNNIENCNIFRLECCKQMVHHDCIVDWINANIDRELPDYNKCVLCKSYNSSLNDYYNDLLTTRRSNAYINLDNSNNNVLVNINPSNNIPVVYRRFPMLYANIICITIIIIFIGLFIYTRISYHISK